MGSCQLLAMWPTSGAVLLSSVLSTDCAKFIDMVGARSGNLGECVVPVLSWGSEANGWTGELQEEEVGMKVPLGRNGQALETSQESHCMYGHAGMMVAV